MKRKPGRPRKHPVGMIEKRLAIVCTDDEWEALLAALPDDARERYAAIFNAVTGVTTQENSKDE